MRYAVLLCTGLLLSSSLADGEAPSRSRLSIHLIGAYTDGARRIVQAGPPVLKVLDLSPDMLRAIREYKRLWPEGRTVVRVYTPPFPPGDDPEAAGGEFFDRVLGPAVEGLTPEDRALIDYLEGPNECEHYDAWRSPESAAWYARLCQSLARRIADAGFRPCVGSIPVGNPPGTREEVQTTFATFIPALRTAHELGGAWSYHSYSLEYSTDLAKELWTSLRYRMLHEVLEREAPDLADMPLILTESGIDLSGNPDTDGWQARGTTEQFTAWLDWYDARLREDDYVLGTTLFQSGCPYGWRSFEVEPVSGWIAQHLAEHRR